MRPAGAADSPRALSARIAPALISGNVAPSRMDCGRMSSAAMDHFTTMSAGPANTGNTDAYAAFVTPTKIQ